MFTAEYFRQNSGVEPATNSPFWTLLGDAEDLAKIPLHHRAQLLFLNKESSELVYQYVEDLKIVNQKLWEPFAELEFQKKEKFLFYLDIKTYKKWLYKREISFSTWILVLPNYNTHPMLMTWKMLLNYANEIFGNSDDLLIMDFSDTWYLFHDHDGEATFVSKRK